MGLAFAFAYCMAHGQGEVRLVIKIAGDPCNRSARNELFDEDDAASPAINGAMANVKAKIDLFKIAMKRNRDVAYSRVQKTKADHAHERAAIPRVQLRAAWHAGGEQLRVNFEVEHRDVPPLRGEKRAGGLNEVRFHSSKLSEQRAWNTPCKEGVIQYRVLRT